MLLLIIKFFSPIVGAKKIILIFLFYVKEKLEETPSGIDGALSM